MAGFFRLQALLLCAVAFLSAPVLAAEGGCSSQFYRGVSPAITSEKLTQQTHAVCFSEIAVLYSGVARTPLWSAEHLTPARIERARGLARLRSNAFHEEASLPEDERSWLSDYKRSGFDRGHIQPTETCPRPRRRRSCFRWRT